ncbi:MAG: lactate racemase domain-containing protein [Anaerolineae bacterium]|nr:lactate racemase domain-containing protein [Anaerolineae bacterium]
MLVPMPTLPTMYRLRQQFDRRRLAEPARVLAERLRSAPAMAGLQPGMRVAITAGSRGINHIGELVRAVVDEVRARGAEPFVVPAMGSHGGATAEGQAQMLASLGVSEETAGAPVRSSMEVVEVGRTPEGWPAYCDRIAFEADWIVVMNRVKAHTAFKGEIESGLCKMLAVGLGKHRGAESVHAIGLARAIVPISRVIRERAPVGVGIAIVENSEDKTYDLVIASPEEFEATDRELLRLANRLLPRLPFDDLDVLVVREMGKNISGTGMDSNVIGIGRRIGGSHKPEVARVAVLDLTEETHGNALGIGLADLTTRRLVDRIDFKATYTNVITTGFLGTARIPITLDTDREVIAVALSGYQPAKVRMAVIRNTLELEEMLISEGLVEEARANPSLVVEEAVGALQFDAEGRLL